MNNTYREQKAGSWRSAGRMALFLAVFGLATTGIVSAGIPVYHYLKPVKKEIVSPNIQLLSVSLAEYQRTLRLR